MRIEFICENDEIRLSEELKQHVSRKLYKNIKSSKAIIYVNGEERKTFEPIKKGDRVTIDYISNENLSWPLYESTLDIRYESDDYLVVYKRPGLLSIPTKAEPYSMFQEVMYYLRSKNEPLTVSILNRLDKETSGLMVVAKNRLAAYNLQPTHLKMERRYLAILDGRLLNKEGRIETYIKKDSDSNRRLITASNDIASKIAISNYRVIEEYSDSSLVEFILETGRTHQIRVHSQYLGHPIKGDMMYGGSEAKRMCLLSYYVKFKEYKTNEEVLVQIGSDFNE